MGSTQETLIRKLASRKFLLSVAAFLAALGAGLSGVASPETCVVMMAVSAALYAACEAYADGAAAKAVQQVYTESVTKAVTATSADKATVVAAFKAPEKVDE